MKRYIKIYIALIRINFANLFAYRANLISSIVSSLVWSTFVMTSITLLTSKSSHVFGWSRNELLILSGVYNMIYSIFYMFFSRNFEEFPNRIHTGLLDGVLLKPISSQFYMSSWNISFNNIVRFVIGSAFVFILLPSIHATISFFTVIAFAVLFIFSVSAIYSIWFIVMTLTIWFSHLKNLIDLLYSLNGVTRYPREMYQKISIVLLWFIFPLTVVIISPAKVLIQNITLFDIFSLLIVSMTLLVISHFFWKFALRFYTSVG